MELQVENRYSRRELRVACFETKRERQPRVADSPATLRLSLLHFQIRKSPQVSRTHVRNGPEFKSIAIPMQNIIAILGETLHGCTAARFRSLRPGNKYGRKLVIYYGVTE